MIVIEVGNKFPENCGKCPLFHKGSIGMPNYCSTGGKYTRKEIDNEADGNLNMYYHGYLHQRPKNCPLKKINVKEKNNV